MLKKKFSAGLIATLIVSLSGIGHASADPNTTDNNGFYYSFTKGHSVLHVNCDELPGMGGNWNTGVRVSPEITGTIQVTGTCDTPDDLSDPGGLSFGDQNKSIDEANYPGSISFGGATYSPQDNWLHAVPASFTVSKTQATMVTITSGNWSKKLTIYGVPLDDADNANNANLGSVSTRLANPTGMTLLKTETMSISGTNPLHMIIPDLADAGDRLNLAGNSDCEIKKGFHVYATKQITITKAGDFSFRAVATTPLNPRVVSGAGTSSNGLGDPFLAVYKTFDPADPDSSDPAKQVVGCNDDNGDGNEGVTTTGYIVSRQLSNFTANLQTGNYTLVLTTWPQQDGATWDDAAANWSTLVSDEGTNGVQSTTFELWGPAGAFDTESTCSTSVGTAYFKAGSSSLTKATKKSLRKWAQTVKDSGCSAISLKGYTATTTNYSKSQKASRVKLAKARNAAVAKYLKAQFTKIGADITINKQSFGAADPVASNKKSSKRWKNRRVEIILAES